MDRITENIIKASVLKSEYGIKNLDDLKTVLEYIVSNEFKEDYESELKESRGVTFNNKEGFIGFFDRNMSIYLFDKETSLGKEIGELWIDYPEKWNCKITPVLNVNLSKNDWWNIEAEFIDKWNNWIDSMNGKNKNWKVNKHSVDENGKKIEEYNMGYGYFSLGLMPMLKCLEWEG